MVNIVNSNSISSLYGHSYCLTLKSILIAQPSEKIADIVFVISKSLGFE